MITAKDLLYSFFIKTMTSYHRISVLLWLMATSSGSALTLYYPWFFGTCRKGEYENTAWYLSNTKEDCCTIFWSSRLEKCLDDEETSVSPSTTPTKTPTSSPTKKPTASPTKKPTASPTKRPNTAPPTKKPTSSPTKYPSASPTKEQTTAPTEEPTHFLTNFPTVSPTENPTASPTKRPTIAPTSPPTKKPTSSPTKHPTTSPTKNPTGAPTRKPTLSPTKTPTASPIKNPTASPTKRPTVAPTSTTTKKPTTSSPTNYPTDFPSDKQTTTPTKKPTTFPTKSPTASPTTNPTPSPTRIPTAAPTELPTKKPTSHPTGSPSKKPTTSPTNTPTPSPTKGLTHSPTRNPAPSPSKIPTEPPTKHLTNNPTSSPTKYSTASPTKMPTSAPSKIPTSAPSKLPTHFPTASPAKNPTTSPIKIPTITPTEAPTNNPTSSPTEQPTASPTRAPTTDPTKKPSHFPSKEPTASPAKNPTISPIEYPTVSPTNAPTAFPTMHPTTSPTKNPTEAPSEEPTSSPTTKQQTSTPSKSPSQSPSSKTASISGFVWHDTNADSIQDEDEPGLESATIYLFNDDTDLVATATSDPSGSYTFSSLIPDEYYSIITAPSQEYRLSPSGVGSDSVFDPGSFTSSSVTVEPGDIIKEANAGIYKLASVSDRVWNDSNSNGIQDAKEVSYNGPVTINLYDAAGDMIRTSQVDANGSYSFTGVEPGNYEVEFIVGDGIYFTAKNAVTDDDKDSDVDPYTGKAGFTLMSGESKTNLAVGISPRAVSTSETAISGEGLYYPDWTNNVQICTNDGFHPSWMTANYLFKSKEDCCKEHFWWRMAHCMENEEYKFYKNGDICDTKIHFEDWEINTPADWTDSTLFDTLDECCTNTFWYDFDGCMTRSPLLFKFEFCLQIKGLVEPRDCQSADIVANAFESTINAGLDKEKDENSVQESSVDANITAIGDITLSAVEGITVCRGSFVNDKTDNALVVTDGANTTMTICGVITVEDANCKQADCLTEHYENVASILEQYVDDGSFTSYIKNLALARLPPVPELFEVTGIRGSFVSSGLLLPATITGDENHKYYHGTDLKTCMKKSVFLAYESPYDSLYKCCRVDFSYDIKTCCEEGGGCPELSTGDNSGQLQYYPTWKQGMLCHSKTKFETWESRYATLEKCCNAHFGYDQAACMNPTK